MAVLKFAVTEESARLARWLRLMGYDARLLPSANRSAVILCAYNEGRILLTRNWYFPQRPSPRTIHLRSERVEEQIRQLTAELGLGARPEAMFSRCSRCNAEVVPVEKALVKAQVPPYVYQTQEQLYQCPSCRKLFWAGTHQHRIREFLRRAGVA